MQDVKNYWMIKRWLVALAIPHWRPYLACWHVRNIFCSVSNKLGGFCITQYGFWQHKSGLYLLMHNCIQKVLGCCDSSGQVINQQADLWSSLISDQVARESKKSWLARSLISKATVFIVALMSLGTLWVGASVKRMLVSLGLYIFYWPGSILWSPASSMHLSQWSQDLKILKLYLEIGLGQKFPVARWNIASIRQAPARHLSCTFSLAGVAHWRKPWQEWNEM